MELKMEVYTPRLELIGVLEKYKSVIWEDKAFTAGSFSVDALLTEETQPLLKEDNIIWLEGTTAGIIEDYAKNAENYGTYITVKGRLLTGILERRILWGFYNLSGTAPEIMEYLVDECAVHPTRGDTTARKIPGLVIPGGTAGGAQIRQQITGGYLLDALETIGMAYKTAFGVRFNPAVPQMEFWTRPCVDRSVHQRQNEQVFYSTELDDVLSSAYSYNSLNWRNVAYVAGEGEGADRKMVVVEESVPETPDIPVTPPEPVLNVTITLSVDPSGGGFASGGGKVEIGRKVSVTALPADGYAFVEWRENGETVSADRTYTFTAKSNRALTAIFAEVIPSYTVTVSADPDGGGTVSGGGAYDRGSSVTVTAIPAKGYVFVGWTENGEAVSENASYTFTAQNSRNLTAVFAVKPSRLPEGYTEVEYISNGTNSNTNYRPFFKMPGTSSAVKMEIELEFTSKISGNSYLGILGYMSNTTSGYTLATYGDRLRYLYGTTAYDLAANFQAATKYVIDFDYTNKNFVVNGSVISKSPGRNWRTNANYLFFNGYFSYSGLKIYSVKMWDENDALALEFVPCINPSGAAGMYDLIGKKFYKKENTSASAEDFTPGPAV